jgi:hypothetical protein
MKQIKAMNIEYTPQQAKEVSELGRKMAMLRHKKLSPERRREIAIKASHSTRKYVEARDRIRREKILEDIKKEVI